MNIIQLNKYVNLHDGETIFYSKYEYIEKAYEDIRNKNHDVKLIVGGSDMCIYNEHLIDLPKNVKKAYFLNCHIDKDLWDDLIVPIPLGIEVDETVLLTDYAQCLGFPNVANEKKQILSNPPNKNASKFIYSNFRVSTNLSHRQALRKISIDTPHINWVEPRGMNEEHRIKSGHSYIEFVNDVLDHKAVMCAQGNDMGDNLRIYESLYLSRVPLTFNVKLYENLHHIFPTVLIEDMSELQDYKTLKKRVDAALTQLSSTRRYLDFNYWKNLILKEVNTA